MPIPDQSHADGLYPSFGMRKPFISGIVPPSAESKPGWWFAFHGNLLNFPRLSSAVIVLVERGHEVLLARSHHFAPGMFSVLAGFVEPGETLEETVRREIKEKVPFKRPTCKLR